MMRVKIKKSKYCHCWHMRDYLVGRTCEVLAVIRGTPDDSYFVLHPITKKPGYYISESSCVVVEESEVPTWEEFLANNKYGYSKVLAGKGEQNECTYV